jgi:hypothetical protein
VRVFNRIVISLEVVLLIIVLIIAAVVPSTLLDRLQYTLQLGRNALELDWPRSYIVFLLVDIVLIFLLLVLLWLQLRPRVSRTINVRGRNGTEAEVSTSSLAQSVQHHISSIRDVSRVRAVVNGVRAGVDLVLDLETRPEIDIPSKMEEVSQAARDLIEGKMGLHVARIKVNVKQVPYSRAEVVPSRPTMQPGIPVPPPMTEVEPGVAGETQAPDKPETE